MRLTPTALKKKSRWEISPKVVEDNKAKVLGDCRWDRCGRWTDGSSGKRRVRSCNPEPGTRSQT